MSTEIGQEGSHVVATPYANRFFHFRVFFSPYGPYHLYNIPTNCHLRCILQCVLIPVFDENCWSELVKDRCDDII